MKRLFSIVLAFSLAAGMLLAAQSSGDDYSDSDDFDAIFADAAGDVEVEQSEPVTAPLSQSSSAISFTGHFNGDVGLFAIIIDKSDFGGYLALDNTLKMTVRPAPVVSIYGALNTSLSNKFTLALSYLYFDYMMFDRIFISAGKKDVSWGYTRLFTNGNIMADTNGQLNAEFRLPWSTGTATFVAAYNYALLSGTPGYRDITYAASIEQTIGHTSANIFAKKYGQSETTSGVHKSPLAGLELKRTILGYDVYAQGYAYLPGFKSFEGVNAIAGFYKLWDAKDPNIGINLEYEYKYIYKPAPGQSSHNNLLWLQWGIKRIGKRKNMKGAVEWQHNFTDSEGKVTTAFIIDGVLPYASWKNGVEVTYGPSRKIPEFKIATTISLSLDY